SFPFSGGFERKRPFSFKAPESFKGNLQSRGRASRCALPSEVGSGLLVVAVAGEVGIGVGGLVGGDRRLGGAAEGPLLLGGGQGPEQLAAEFFHLLLHRDLLS